MKTSTKMTLVALATAATLLQPGSAARAQQQHEASPPAVAEQDMPAVCHQIAGQMQEQMAMMGKMQEHMTMMQGTMTHMQGMPAMGGDWMPAARMHAALGDAEGMPAMMSTDLESIQDPAVADQQATQLSAHLEMMQARMAELEEQAAALRARAKQLRERSR